MHWLTIEVFDGTASAAAWARAWHDWLVEAAVTSGACYWDEHEHRWGVVLEFCFADERARDGFREAAALRAALDAAPDPVAGVLVNSHRGGAAARASPAARGRCGRAARPRCPNRTRPPSASWR